MSVTQNEKKALNELQTKLAKMCNLVDFKLYGSKAVGTDVSGSDLDVMIVVEDLSPAIESKIDDLVFDINLKHDCLITALFFSRVELVTGSLSESPIYKKILQEGIGV